MLLWLLAEKSSSHLFLSLQAKSINLFVVGIKLHRIKELAGLTGGGSSFGLINFLDINIY